MIQMAGGLEAAAVSAVLGASKPARLKDTVPLELEWGTTNCFQTNFRCCCGRHLIGLIHFPNVKLLCLMSTVEKYGEVIKCVPFQQLQLSTAESNCNCVTLHPY